MAGRIQLLTSGSQDRFFTDNPDYTHFLEGFKKHSNFSNQYIDIKPQNPVDFGEVIRFTVPQNAGDLLKTLSLKVSLPQIETVGVNYIESVGHALIEYVDLIVGGKTIQRLTGDYLQIYSEHYVTQTKQIALERLIGKYPLQTSDSRVSVPGIIARGTLGSKKDEEFFVDLPFYFYNHPELAIPLCAITKQEVEVEFKLRDARELVISSVGDLPTLTEILKIKDFQLCVDLVFLDSSERLKIKNTPRDYLITQLQQDVFSIGLGENSLRAKLDFVNPVKELYFVIQRQGTTGDGTSQGNFVTPFDYDNTAEVQDGKYILYENLDYLTLSLDGQDILTKDTGTVPFLKGVQAAIHHSKTQLIRRFYSYSFALQPEEWYPTGQVNFSLVKEQVVNLSLTTCPDFSRQFRVYAESYNILRVHEGIAETLFDTKH
jgi:hypothetical protein